MSYDLIGDVHGHLEELEALLRALGYRPHQGGYRHDARKAVFVGDLIDRGPDSPAVVALARAMVDAGDAHAVMGNHELNALCFHTPDPECSGQHLRPHTVKNVRQHRVAMDQFATQPGALDDALSWFATLPLWLELGDLRVVHACWDPASMGTLQQEGLVSSTGVLREGGIAELGRRGTAVYDAAEVLLKGPERQLPEGIFYRDKEGTKRSEVRVRWWPEPGAPTWRRVAMGPPETLRSLPDAPIEGELPARYADGEPPVVVGHYWLSGDPRPLSSNVACVDYSVAIHGGKLAAYRYEPGQALSRHGFVTVPRSDGSLG